MSDLILYTSDKQWPEKAADNYKNRRSFSIYDDAKIGLDDANIRTLYALLRKGKISREEWLKVFGCLGVSGIGLALCILAYLDPEPTSKLGLLVGSGCLLALTGGLGAIHILTGLKPEVSLGLGSPPRMDIKFA